MSDPRILDDRSFDILFRKARSHNAWQERDVSDVLIRAMYDLLKFGPTSANMCPARFVFVKSAAAKARLKPFMDAGNLAKTMTAPITVIIANDLKFYDRLPQLFPHAPGARDWFSNNDLAVNREIAMRNGSLQGAYMMLAARSLGLDCGPMSGFNAQGIKDEFFPDDDYQVNFLCNIGYGDEAGLFERSPRLGFDEACEIL